MATYGTRLNVVAVLGLLLGALVLAAPPARAQAISSTIAPAVRGLVTRGGAEDVVCAGAATVTTRPVTPAEVTVSIQLGAVSCSGVTSGTAYATTGFARLTRPLVANDVIKTTFAVYPDLPGGKLQARTALLTLSLAYDVVSGAVVGGTGGIGNP